MHKEGLRRNPWPILARSCLPWANDWKQSRWRSLWCMGRSCRWITHLSYVRCRILLLQEQLVDLFQQLGRWHPTIEKTFWFQTSVVYIKTFTPWSWRRLSRAHSLLEVQTMETSIEFFLHLVAMARILVVFLSIHRKSRRKKQAKACDRSEQPVVYRTLAKTSDEWLSRIHFFVTARSFTADVGLL